LFFPYFNEGGALTSLPDGSFDTSNITTVKREGFFNSFNKGGALTSLPVGSFDTSNITTAEGGVFFSDFNNSGALTSLPVGSFDTSNISGSVGFYFFYYFNYNGALTSLPEGSFNTSKITTVGNDFFSYFNNNRNLTSLPDGSFDISNITTLGIEEEFDFIRIKGYNFFLSFNNNGNLTSLPEGSFISTLSQTEINEPSVFDRTFYNNPNLELNASTMTPYATITPSLKKDTFSGSKVYVRDDAGWNATQIDYWGVNVREKDITPPTATFTPNGSGTYAKSHTTTVNVTDTNLKTNSLKYQRTTSTSAPTEASFSSTFTNNSSLTKSDGNGTFYLRILAKDTAGNTLITGSNGFNIDNTAPTCGTRSYAPTTPTSGNVVATLTGSSDGES
jgi:surface protein